MEEFDPELATNKFRRSLEQAWIKKNTLLLTALKNVGPKDLYKFNKFILQVEKGDNSFVSMAPFHKKLCNFVTDQKDKKKLILIPRGHLKSKLISIGYSIQSIIANPRVRILIYSATWQMAVDLNLSIQKQLQGCKRLNQIWGDLSVGATEWSQDRTRIPANVTREPTVTAAGIDNNLVGGHYDIIIMDDVVNRDNVATQDQIIKVIQRYKDSLDLLEPKGQLIVIGTRWHDSDLYGWILDPDNDIKASYEVLIEKAYDGNVITGDNFEALWGEKFTREELKRRLREEGWAHFSAQYLNDPVPEEDAVFKRTWFQYYDLPDLKGRLFNKFLLIDPAISISKDADYTAFVVVGHDQYGYIFILDIIRARYSPNDIINTIFTLRDKWNLVDIGIEEVAFQKALAYSLRDDDRFKRRPFHITELKPGERSKDTRIKGLQPLYENGKIYHNKLLQNNIYLEDELVRFPRSTHDDICDALSYITDIIYPARQKANREIRHKYLY